MRSMHRAKFPFELAHEALQHDFLVLRVHPEPHVLLLQRAQRPLENHDFRLRSLVRLAALYLPLELAHGLL